MIAPFVSVNFGGPVYCLSLEGVSLCGRVSLQSVCARWLSWGLKRAWAVSSHGGHWWPAPWWEVGLALERLQVELSARCGSFSQAQRQRLPCRGCV